MGNCINKSKNKNTVLLDKISLHNIPFQIQATGDNQSKAKFRDLIEPGIVSWIAAYLDPVPGLRLRHLSKEFRAGVSYDIKVAGIQLQRIRTVLHGDDMKLLQKLLQKLCPSVYLGALWISTGMWNQDYCDLVEEFSENELTAMTKPVLAYLKECNIELAKICSIGTLAWACKRKFINLARIFLDQGKVDLAEYVETILIECVGYLEVVKLLVEFGADPNNCIEFAAREGIVEMLRYLISLPTVDPGAGNNEALVLAVIGGHAECVEILLESPKVSPSARNNVPIREAARLGHTAIFRMLMSREGVDVDVDNRYCLRVAFYFKHRDIAYLLLPYHSQKNIDLTMLVGHLGAHLLKRENNLSAIFDLLGTTTDSDSDDDGDAGTQLLTSVFSKSVAKEENIDGTGLETELSQLASTTVQDTEYDSDHMSTFGVSLKFLLEFVASQGGKNALQSLTTTDICEKIVKPMTEKSQLSLCDLLLTQERTDIVQEASWFVSHAWKYLFVDAVDALELFFSERGDDPATTFIWFDLFSNSQHGTGNRPFHWWQTTFMSAIAKMKNVVMILQPWDDPIPLTRAWCLFELYSTQQTGSSFHVSMSPKEAERFAAGIASNSDAFYKILAHVDCEKSVAWNPKDKDQIFAVVRQDTSFNALNRMVLLVFQKWLLSKVDKYRQVAFEEPRNNAQVMKLSLVMGRLCVHQGEARKAVDVFKEGYDIAQTEEGGNSDAMLNFASELYKTYLVLKDNDRAQLYADQAMEYEKKHERSHNTADKLQSLNNIGAHWSSRGEYQKALMYYKECYEGRMKLLGPNAEDTLTTMNNLAVCYMKMERFDEALPLLEGCYKRRTQTLGEGHPYTLATTQDLIFVYREQNQYEKATDLAETSLSHVLRIFPDNHPDTILARRSLAELARVQDQHSKAEPLFKKIYEIECNEYGAETEAALETLLRVGKCQCNQSNFQTAGDTLRKTFESCKRVLKGHNRTLLDAAYELLMVYDRTKDERVLGILSFLRNSAVEANTLSVQCTLSGQFEKAEDYCYEGLKFFRTTEGDGSQNTIMIQKNLGEVNYHSRDYKKSKKWFEIAYENNCRVNGRQHPLSLSIAETLSEACFQ